MYLHLHQPEIHGLPCLPLLGDPADQITQAPVAADFWLGLANGGSDRRPEPGKKGRLAGGGGGVVVVGVLVSQVQHHQVSGIPLQNQP